MDDDRGRSAPNRDDDPEGEKAAHERDVAAHERDVSAHERDRRAAARDEESSQRDHKADARDERLDVKGGGVGGLDAEAGSARGEAARDRQGAADDRKHAVDDRREARIDRAISASERAATSIDELTGTYHRDPGLVELAREIARAQRTEQPVVLAFVDVDGLKATNDSSGHQAGDQLLRRVADTMRAYLRSYDLIVRFGGDEFACALAGLSVETVAERFSLINADLATRQASVSVGLAELKQSDSLDHLIARADRALREVRQKRPPAR